MYINYIGKYASAQAIQDALDDGTLANPYVAMTTAGTLDYNTLEPTPTDPTPTDPEVDPIHTDPEVDPLPEDPEVDDLH